MSIGQKGSHSRGPILGDNKAGDGLFEDIPLSTVDPMFSPYKTWREDFNVLVADDAAAGSMGATITASAGVVGNAVIGSNTRFLINAGTAANTGYASVQFNVDSSQATYVANRFNTPGLFGSNATTWAANRELIWFARVGFLSAVAGAWDAGALIGWFVTDTSLLDLATLLPTVAVGGGIGFHIGPTGVVSAVCNDAAITTAGTAVGTIAALTTATVWYEFGVRFKVTTFSTQTGNADFYFGPLGSMRKVLSSLQSGTLPIANNAGYSSSFAVINGAALATDMILDAMYTGTTRTTQTGTV